MIGRWLFAFAATLVIETPIMFAVLGARVPPMRRVSAAVMASCLTHPILWFVAPSLFTSHGTYIVTCECLIVLVETVVLRAWAGPGTMRDCFAASALANGASYGAGVLFHALT